jgi:glutaredoxin
MRVLALLLAFATLGAGIVVATREGDGASLLLAALRAAGPSEPAPSASPSGNPADSTAALPPSASAGRAPATSTKAGGNSASGRIELISGGETSLIEEGPDVVADEPLPLYRYIDASGSIRMVEGLRSVPPRYRSDARSVKSGAGAVNRVTIPARQRTAFRDWQPEFNPNRTAITLYSAPGCSACGRAKAHLERLGVAYELRDIQRDPRAKSEVRAILGRVVVPLLQVGNRYVSGYLPREYDRVAAPGR